MDIKNDYQVIIPAFIRFDDRLPIGARMLYGDLIELSKDTGYCIAKDSDLMELYHVSNSTIESWLRYLDQYGYIIRETMHIKQMRVRKIYITNRFAGIPQT